MTGRLFLAIAGGLLALSSCSAGSIAPAGSVQEPSGPRSLERRSPSQGGDFSAEDSGLWNLHKRPCGISCVTWKFHGSGSATFLGSNREHGVVYGGVEIGDSVFVQSGSTQNFIRVYLSGGFCSPHMTYTVAGGKGIFKSATGSGTIHFNCTGTKRGTYKDRWSGTLYY